MMLKSSTAKELMEVLCAPEPTDLLERFEAESVEEPDELLVELWRRDKDER